MKILLPSILSLFVITSCLKKKTLADVVKEMNDTDSVVVDIPKGNRSVKYELAEKIRMERVLKQLEFPPLERFRRDSVVIRIWYGGPMTGERIIVLKNDYKKWTAAIHLPYSEVNPEYKERKDSITGWNYDEQYIYKSTMYFAKPNSGWGNFLKKMLDYEILTLPDESRISNYEIPMVMDGDGVTVEVATKKLYRKYSYTNPSRNRNKKVPQPQQILMFVKFMDDEFNLPYIVY